MQSRVHWPEGRCFAFTVFDDTDHTTLANGPQVYELLTDLGMRTTKSVWPISGRIPPTVGGATCEDPDYLAWVTSLRDKGFEIAFHNATFSTSDRAQALRGMARFRQLFGTFPNAHANHADCRDGIYWGPSRMTGVNRIAYLLLTKGRNRGQDGGTNLASA